MPRPGIPRFIALALTAGAVLWVAALVSATLVRGSGFSTVVYGIASTVCHQRPERSFAIAGNQFPVCARCAGLYVSGALAALAAWFGMPRTARTRELLLLAALPTVVTIPVEWMGLSALSNTIRASAALPFGAAAGWSFVRALRSEDVAL